MKRVLFLTACVAAAVSLSACTNTGTAQLLDNLQGCERHYDGAVAGSLTGGSFSGTIKVDCKPAQGGSQVQPTEPTPPPGGA